MLERDEIKIVLEMAIEKIENEKIIESIQNLANTYTSNSINYNSIQTQNKNFKKICQSETWKEFSSSQINFLKSYDIYNYLGEANHTLLSGLTHDNYGDNNKIRTLLIAHAVSTTERLRSCKSLLNVIEAGHFVDINTENFESAFISGDKDKAYQGIEYIREIAKEKIEVTEEQLEKINEKLDGLKFSVEKLDKSMWEGIFTGVVQDISKNVILDPAQVETFLTSIKASFNLAKAYILT